MSAPDAAFTVGPRVTTSDGVGIATYDLGGHGPPLLLAHATGLHGLVWLPMATGLRSRYRCVAFDSRGHGQSAKAPDGDYDWHGLALDALAVVDGLGLGRPRAVGHSAGGAALLLAEEARPGAFASLYCYEPVVPIIPDGPAGGPTAGGRPAAPSSPDGHLLAAGARRRREVFASIEAALANYADKRPFNAFDPAALDAYVRYGFDHLADGTVRLRCRGEDEARVYEAVLRHQAFQHLGDVACPVTLACGGPAGQITGEHLAAMAARLRRVTLEVHPDLGHFGPIEAPTQMANAVADALSAMDVADALSAMDVADAPSAMDVAPDIALTDTAGQ